MAAAVTYEGDLRRSAPDQDGIFAGQKLWFSRAIPQRERLMHDAEQNGAQIVQLEQQADVKLVDHLRKNHAPGTHSYRYVELSVRNGQLEDLDAHRVGSATRAERPVGSVMTASKVTRNKFTDDEDQLLWNWVKPYMDVGGAWKGNDIYKQLEAVNPNHTFQSWRDRWIKITRFQDRRVTQQVQTNEGGNTQLQANSGAVHSKQESSTVLPPRVPDMGATQSTQVNGSDSLAVLHEEEQEKTQIHHEQDNDERNDQEQDEGIEVADQIEAAVADDLLDQNDAAEPEANDDDDDGDDDDDAENSVALDGNQFHLAFNFSQAEAIMLYNATCHILDARSDTLEDSWAGVAQEWGHTKEAWRSYFYKVILPEYKRRNGIETEEQLEAHYQKELNDLRLEKRRERAAKEARVRAEKLASAEDVPVSDNLSARGGILRSSANLRDSIERHVSLNESQKDGRHSRSPHNEGRAARASTPTDDTHRPPKPNESRKLSQSKGSQSTSSQSQSRSILTSQASQQSQALATVPEYPDLPMGNTFSSPVNTRQYESPELQRGPRRISNDFVDYPPTKRQRRDPPSSGNRNLSVSQESEEQNEQSGRFVTQISLGRETSPTDSNMDLQDIPYRERTPSQTRRRSERSESPLFMPEDSDQAPSPKSPPHFTGDDLSEIGSSPMAVRLVEGGDVELEDEHISEYAPSEAPSEGVQFETEARLSQAWDTAPEKIVTRDDIEYHNTITEANRSHSTEDVQSFEDVARDVSRVLSQQDSEMEKVAQQQGESNGQDEFETAPTMLPVGHNAPKEGPIETTLKPNGVTKTTLDTQALFQQPTQTDLADLIAIPEPPGGWDDEDIVEPTEEPTEAIATNTPPDGEADWTLPLPDPDPDPDLSTEDAPTSQAEESSDADIDDWLQLQTTSYPNIPAFLLTPFSHRALECTSMNLHVADTVLSQMILRFEKGKYPAHRHLSVDVNIDIDINEIKLLPKRERKKVVARITEELIPSGLRGCWTREDDGALLGVDGREVRRVEVKHGAEGVRRRFEFLEMWNSN